MLMQLRAQGAAQHRRPPGHRYGQAQQQCQENPESAHRVEVSPISGLGANWRGETFGKSPSPVATSLNNTSGH